MNHTKTTRRKHYTPIRTVKIKKSDNIKCWQGCRETGYHIHDWGECKVIQPLWKTVLAVLYRTKHLPYNPVIELLSIYLKEIKTYIHTKTCTQMFIAALFITAKNWKQSKCPSISQCLNRNKL